MSHDHPVLRAPHPRRVGLAHRTNRAQVQAAPPPPTLAAVGDLTSYLFVKDFEPDPALIVPKRWDAATTVAALDSARRTIAAVGEVSWESEELEPPLRHLVEERGWKAGDLFMAIRVAITGRTATPPLFDTMVALGYERTLARLDRAIEKLAALAAPTP